jgi:methionyl-tRNA synthetase
MEEFQTRNNNELVAILGNFVNRTLVSPIITRRRRSLKRNKYDSEDESVLAEIGRIKENVESDIHNFRFRDALRNAMNLARLGNKYLADNEPWKVIKTRSGKSQDDNEYSPSDNRIPDSYPEPFLPSQWKNLKGWMNIGKIKWEDANNSQILMRVTR